MNLETVLFLIHDFPQNELTIEGITFEIGSLLPVDKTERRYNIARSENITIVFRSFATYTMEMKYYDLVISCDDEKVLEVEHILDDELLAKPISEWVY
jgi:hypothetical protein